MTVTQVQTCSGLVLFVSVLHRSVEFFYLFSEVSQSFTLVSENFATKTDDFFLFKLVYLVSLSSSVCYSRCIEHLVTLAPLKSHTHCPITLL